MSDLVKVRAIKTGIHNNARVREGGEFWVPESRLTTRNGKPASWYRPVKDLDQEAAEAASTPPDEDLDDLV